jgi:hypothetical protein
MSATKARLATLRALAAGAAAHGANMVSVDQELQEVGWSRNVHPDRRRHLLQVFHGWRALESALNEIARRHGLLVPMTLGAVLHSLAALPAGHSAHLSPGGLSRFVRSIARERNRMVHQANAFPRSTREADQLFGEVAACFALLVK